MTGKNKTSPILLNLAGELLPGWQEYVQNQNITLLDENSANGDMTHILVKPDANFSEIASLYQTVDKDIKLIAMGHVEEQKHFARANGKLILEQTWFEHKLGVFILDKFFQDFSGIALKDNYPAFQELGSFNITNPFSTGEYLDHMVYKAFESGLSALSVKTYFDHLLMYLAYQRAVGKLGMPIEVTYGAFDGVFGLQLHFFTDKMNLKEVIDSLSRESSKPEDDLLKIAVSTSQFFDLTYLDNVKKAVLTGLWCKGTEIKTTNKGFLLASIEESSTINQFQGEASLPYFASGKEIPDLTGLLIPGTETEAIEETTVLKGTDDLTEATTLVRGPKEAPEARTVVGGSKEEAESRTTVTGTKDEKVSNTRVKGQAEAKDNTVHRFSSAPEKKAEEMKVNTFSSLNPEKGDMTVTSLGHEALLQQEIQKLQKQIQAKEQLVAKILADQDKHIAASVEKSQKENEHLKSKMVILGNELRVLRETQNKLQERGKQAEQALTEEQFERLVDPGPERTIKRLQLEAQNKEAFFNRQVEKLQRQLVTKDTAIEKLKEGMALALKKKDDQIGDLHKKLEKDIVQSRPVGQFENMEFRDFGDNKKTPDIVPTAPNQETVKLFHEANQKNIIFQRTVDQLERENASKSMMIDKNRDNFNAAIEKRENEIKELKDRINKILQEGARDNTQGQQLVHLERQNQYLSKMNETYKNKITSLLAEIESLKTPEAKDDAKRMQMLNVQNKHMIESLKRDVQRYQDKSATDLATITALRGEKNKLEIELKKATSANKVEKDTSNFEAELKKAQLQIQSMENQLKDSTNKLKDMEAKLAEARKSQSAQSSTQDGQSKAKISHLEASIKKLTQDLLDNKNQLGEAKKEVNKIRLEKTAIQNELEKLKKETDKAKAAAAPKKPTPGGKAA